MSDPSDLRGTPVTGLREQLETVCADLARNGWHVDPIPTDASDIDLLARLHEEQARNRIRKEDLERTIRAIREGQ